MTRLARACFRKVTVLSEGVHVTAQTIVTFRVGPSGVVSKVAFEPPLAPAVQSCISIGASAVSSVPTLHGFQTSHVLVLER
jgi:hypothetical protein